LSSQNCTADPLFLRRRQLQRPGVARRMDSILVFLAIRPSYIWYRKSYKTNSWARCEERISRLMCMCEKLAARSTKSSPVFPSTARPRSL
jgi:hypothetical protein